MRKSLRTQLILTLVLLTIIPLLSIGGDTISRTMRVQRQQAVSLQQEIVRRVATQVETYIFSREEELRLLIDVQGLTGLETAQQEAALRNLVLKQDVYSEVVLIDKNGRTIAFESPIAASAQAEPLTSYEDSPIFRVPRDSGRTYYGSLQIDAESGEPFMTIAIPFVNLTANDFDGVLAANIRFQPMWTLMEDIRNEIKGVVYVVDGDNRVIAHSNRSVVLQGTRANLPSTDGFVAGLDGKEVVLAQRFIPLGLDANSQPLGLNVVAEVTESEALALANSTINSTIWAIFVATLVSLFVGAYFAVRITRPIVELADAAQAISAGDLSRQVAITRKDEIGTLGAAFNSMTGQLRSLISVLEQRVASRTQDLNLAAEIGRQVSQVQHLDQLLPQAVQLVQERFNLYQTQIYLVDDSGDQLVLRASTGHAGTRLLEAGHTLPIDENSLNGTAAASKEAVIVADTAQSEAFRPHPLLPDTRSEMVVPLTAGETIVGVIDLQSSTPNALTEDNLPAFLALAGQLAIAIQNAALLSARRRVEAELSQASELAGMASWSLDVPTMTFGANERFSKLLKVEGRDGFGQEVGLETFLERFVHPEDRAEVQGKIAAALQHPDPNFRGQLEYRALRGDGSIMYALVEYRFAFNERNEPVTVYGSFLDVTERMLAEKKLMEEQARTQEILESINVPLVISRLSDGIVAYVNEPLAEIIRIPREELIGQVTPDFYYNPADRDAYIKGLRERGQVANFELRLKRGDGDTLWTLVSGRIINFQGEPAIISSLVDISERREAQATITRRAAELETVANVGTVAAASLEPEELLQQVVNLTKERFELYHAHLYLLDENKTELNLANGAGEIGARMVAEGRRIALNQEQSLVARAARTQRGVVSNNVHEEPGFLPHPLLPETQAEMAVPLVVGSDVLGVLDVQADRINRFTSEDVNVFTTLASQIAVALQNARRHDEAVKALDELTRLQRIMVREGWEDYLTADKRPHVGYAFNRKGAKPVAEKNQEGAAPAAEEVENGAGPETAVHTVDIPIAVRGEQIGKIGLRNPDGSQIPERKQALLQNIANQVSEALERARLTEQTQRALTQAEKRSQEVSIINKIVTQISTSLDLQHSLQIVVDELAMAVNVDQVRVALIQPEKNELLVIAEHYDPSRASSAVGLTIPLEGNDLTLSVIETRRIVVVEDAQNSPQTAPVHELFRQQGIETVILMPLVVNDEVIGTLGMDILDRRSISADSLRLAETLVFQTATAIQNARLFEQVQATLAETEMLYAYSSQLNTATNLNAVLDSAAAPGMQVGATDAWLLVYDRNTTGNPEFAQIAAIVPRDDKRVGEHLYLPELPTRYLWPASGQNTVFVGDVTADERLSPEDRETLNQQGVQALAIMSLNVGNLRLGQIIIHWNKAQTFTNADERLYGAIAQQASSVVYNRLLFNQTEEALSETAALYQASADLNTAQTYDDVVTALRRHSVLGHDTTVVNLDFFSEAWDENQLPEAIISLGRWTSLPHELPKRFRLADFPEAAALLKPDEPFICADIAQDERLSEETRGFFTQLFAAKSLIYIPLVVAGQWVGYVSGAFAEPIHFNETQLRRLNALSRQAAVSAQSIRLFEQTEAALAETEALYQGSESIVLSNSEQEVLRGLIQSTALKNLDRANIFLFDDPVEDGVARNVTAVAIWENDGVPRTVEVGTRFTVDQVPFLRQITPLGALTISDVREDPRIDEQTCQILESYGMRSFVLFPLVVGNQWLGMISGQSAAPLTLDPVQIRRANSLVGQAAVVIQTTVLFRQEQARARREQLLREIATKVRSSTDIDTIMQTAVTEIGRTLGRRSFIKLGEGQNGKAQADTGRLSPIQKENGAT